MIKTLSAVLLCGTVIFAAKPAVPDQQTMQLENLKVQITAARDSQQVEIADRWRAKQAFVAKRESDKEETDRLREKQEKAYNELARVKEEKLAKSTELEESRAGAAAEQDNWNSVGASVEEVLAKAGDDILAGFPLDREERRRSFETIRAEYKRTANPSIAIEEYFSYNQRFIGKGLELSLVKQTVLPDTGKAVELSIARFGNVFAYGISDSGTSYILDQTGRLGAERFAVGRISAPDIAGFLKQTIPLWVAAGAISGQVPVDVMHNDASRILLSGKKADATARFRQWFKNGGPVMIPLALVAIWGLLLFMLKLIEFGSKQPGGKKRYRELAAAMDSGDMSMLKSISKQTGGLVGKICGVCSDNYTDRAAAENGVRKLLIDETPKLSRHINTLAVLATAAPLLGLLGTVTGMINLLAVLTQYGNSDPKLVAGGISEALVTTQAGMIIAIPIVLIHNYLRNRREAIIAAAEQHAIAILNRRWPS